MAQTKIDPVLRDAGRSPTAIAVDHAGDTRDFCESACTDTFRDDHDRWNPQASTVES